MTRITSFSKERAKLNQVLIRFHIRRDGGHKRICQWVTTRNQLLEPVGYGKAHAILLSVNVPAGQSVCLTQKNSHVYIKNSTETPAATYQVNKRWRESKITKTSKKRRT